MLRNIALLKSLYEEDNIGRSKVIVCWEVLAAQSPDAGTSSHLVKPIFYTKSGHCTCAYKWRVLLVRHNLPLRSDFLAFSNFDRPLEAAINHGEGKDRHLRKSIYWSSAEEQIPPLSTWPHQVPDQDSQNVSSCLSSRTLALTIVFNQPAKRLPSLKAKASSRAPKSPERSRRRRSSITAAPASALQLALAQASTSMVQVCTSCHDRSL